MKYDQVFDGDWVKPRRAYHKIACCDCGLVHLLRFRQAGKHVEFQVWRDERATAGRRRGAKIRERIKGLALKIGLRAK